MAAAETEAVPVDQLESLLICSICLETLNDPRTLPCFHSFCKCCLEKFVKSNREKTVGKEIEQFNCPTCRLEFILKPSEEVVGMTSSHFIRNMLDVMAIQRQAKTSKCSVCQEPAITRCSTCEMYMCEKCLAHHYIWPGNKKHTVLSINELTQTENQTKIRGKLHCKKHENKRLKFYCETCKELICRYCMDFDHIRPDHFCYPSADVAKNQREILRSRCVSLEESLTEGKETLKLISYVTQLLEDNTEKAINEIERRKKVDLETFTRNLEEQAKRMKNEVAKKRVETFESLTKQSTEMKYYVDKVKGSFNLAKNLLEKGNDEEILSSQKMIEENVEKVKAERPWSMKPVHDGHIEYQATLINDIDIRNFLDKLGKIACHPVAWPCDLRQTSTILNVNHEYCKQLKEWLNEQFQWRLCYRASRDGWRATDFHNFCDNKGPTVVLIKVEDYIFGGYSDQNWEGKEWKWSDSSFLFSLRNKDNLPPFKAPINKNHNHAIYCSPTCGPVFGRGTDLHICDQPHIDDESHTGFGRTYRPPEGYFYKSQQTNSLLAGSYYFKPTEIEVFW